MNQVPADVNWLYYFELDYFLVITLCLFFGWITLKIYSKRMNPENKLKQKTDENI